MNKIILLFLIIILCSGCTTFTNAKLRTHNFIIWEKAYVEGYREGKEDGFLTGKMVGLIEGLDIKNESKTK